MNRKVAMMPRVNQALARITKNKAKDEAGFGKNETLNESTSPEFLDFHYFSSHIQKAFEHSHSKAVQINFTRDQYPRKFCFKVDKTVSSLFGSLLRSWPTVAKSEIFRLNFIDSSCYENVLSNILTFFSQHMGKALELQHVKITCVDFVEYFIFR